MRSVAVRPWQGLTLAVLVLVGCARSTATPVATGFFVKVVNVDGPPITVYVGGKKIAERACQTEDLTLTSGDPSLGSFPWTIEIRRLTGASMRSLQVDGPSGKPQLILVRGDGVLVG